MSDIVLKFHSGLYGACRKRLGYGAEATFVLKYCFLASWRTVGWYCRNTDEIPTSISSHPIP